ncbi:sugar transferase [Candidatus Falkowbacteria bacterium]|nr:sugar transferase [Patescibacteria group bacterium]NCU42924.1 sugar transferase [Candidatus Falkowbacteria bacterium]
MNKRFKQVCLALGDLGVLFLALGVSLFIRYGSNSQGMWSDNIFYFRPLFGAWLLILYISGAYKLNLVYNFKRFWQNAVSATIASGLVSIIYFYLIQSPVSPKTILIIFLGVFLLLFLLWRNLASLVIRSFLPVNNLAIIGNTPLSDELLENLAKQPHQGFNTALVFKNIEDAKALPALIKKRNINSIIIAPEFANNPELVDLLFDCLSLNINIYNLSDFYELVYGRVPLSSINQAWFIDNINQGGRRYFDLIKRTNDLIWASFLLLFSLPFFPLIALAIKLDSRGPVLFRQERVGKNERLFTMLKFRTMKTQANNGTMTSLNDKRITRVGNFLRRSRLDEIPQIINIFRGEMSFIGPRPERTEFVLDLSKKIPFYKTRLLIKPGISGWDQVSGIYHSPSLEDSQAKLEYDLFYLKHRSIYLDLSIALKTIATMLSRNGR